MVFSVYVLHYSFFVLCFPQLCPRLILCHLCSLFPQLCPGVIFWHLCSLFPQLCQCQCKVEWLLRGVIFVIRTISFLALMWLVGSKHQTNTNTISHSFTAKIPVYRDEFGRSKTGFSSFSCNIHGHFCLFACFQTVQTWCSDGAKRRR